MSTRAPSSREMSLAAFNNTGKWVRSSSRIDTREECAAELSAATTLPERSLIGTATVRMPYSDSSSLAAQPRA